jgi:hypothetical protein
MTEERTKKKRVRRANPEGAPPPRTVVRFWKLLGEKQAREGRRIDVRDVIAETKLAKNLVYGLANYTVKELPLYACDRLAEYFQVHPSQLLDWRDEDARSTPQP